LSPPFARLQLVAQQQYYQWVTLVLEW